MYAFFCVWVNGLGSVFASTITDANGGNQADEEQQEGGGFGNKQNRLRAEFNVVECRIGLIWCIELNPDGTIPGCSTVGEHLGESERAGNAAWISPSSLPARSVRATLRDAVPVTGKRRLISAGLTS